MIARALGGQVVWGESRKGQWVAVLRFTSAPGSRTVRYPEPDSERATSSATPFASR